MRYIHIPLLLCLLTFSSISFGQTKAPKYSNDFLKIGVGARAMAMGNAQVAIAEDVTAGYWNPAGLASPNSRMYPEVALLHAAYFANLANYNYLAFTMPIDSAGKKRFGASLIRLGIDDIPNTLDLVDETGYINLDRVTSFSASDFAAIFSYAWEPNFLDGLSLGANVKVIYRGVGRFANAWGIGLDIAARYQIKRLKLGLVLYDATNTFNAWTFNTTTFEEAFANTGNVVPQNSVEYTRPSARLGLGYDFDFANRKLNLTLAFDNVFYFDGQRNTVISTKAMSIDPNFGLELAYRNKNGHKIAFLRGGIYNIQDSFDSDGQATVGAFPTAGVGFAIKNFQLDYALSNIGNLSENLHSHIVSAKFYIGN